MEFKGYECSDFQRPHKTKTTKEESTISEKNTNTFWSKKGFLIIGMQASSRSSHNFLCMIFLISNFFPKLWNPSSKQAITCKQTPDVWEVIQKGRTNHLPYQYSPIYSRGKCTYCPVPCFILIWICSYRFWELHSQFITLALIMAMIKRQNVKCLKFVVSDRGEITVIHRRQ